MCALHGGDWAGYLSEFGAMPLDFSANTSPLGLPPGVRRAAEAALDDADRYPDPACRELRRALAALTYGDLLMLLANQTRPYEKHPGETDAHVDRWVQEICGQFLQGKGFQPKAIKAQLGRIVADFETVELLPVRKVKVGIVPSIRPWPTTTWRSSSAPRTARSTSRA